MATKSPAARCAWVCAGLNLPGASSAEQLDDERLSFLHVEQVRFKGPDSAQAGQTRHTVTLNREPPCASCPAATPNKRRANRAKLLASGRDCNSCQSSASLRFEHCACWRGIALNRETIDEAQLNAVETKRGPKPVTSLPVDQMGPPVPSEELGPSQMRAAPNCSDECEGADKTSVVSRSYEQPEPELSYSTPILARGWCTLRSTPPLSLPIVVTP